MAAATVVAEVSESCVDHPCESYHVGLHRQQLPVGFERFVAEADSGNVEIDVHPSEPFDKVVEFTWRLGVGHVDT